MSKIFGVGLSRTGTHSLVKALQVLGYKAQHCFHDMRRFETIDAGADIPVAYQFRLLDRKYPGSKFILTLRDRDAWLESVRRLLEKRPLQKGTLNYSLWQSLYGTTESDDWKLGQAYGRHTGVVAQWFRNRPGSLLAFRLCDIPDKWEKLCAFLGKEVPNVPFPHEDIETWDPKPPPKI